MNDIAARAEVAVQTVYFVFHTKAELLSACFDYAVLGPERLPPQQQEFWSEMTTARSGRAALAAFVRGNTAILARVAVVDEVAQSVPHEPDAADVVANSERLRREGYGEAVAILADRFGLRAGLTVDTAIDLLLMFGSSPTYLTLRRYGWSEEGVRRVVDRHTRQAVARSPWPGLSGCTSSSQNLAARLPHETGVRRCPVPQPAAWTTICYSIAPP